MNQASGKPAIFNVTCPVPLNEFARLQALAELKVLDTGAEPAFDAVVRQAAGACETPIALISLVDRERQWSKARIGLDARETPRHMAFCAHAILGSELFEIPNLPADQRFANNPLVTGDPGIRFYAGMPLVTAGGLALGTLCVMDRVPRKLHSSQRESLRDLATLVGTLLESRNSAAVAAQLGQILDQAFEEIYVLYPGAQHIQYASANALAKLGYRTRDLQQMTVASLGANYPLDKLHALSRSTAEVDRQAMSFEAAHVRKDGSTYQVEVRATVSTSQAVPQIILLANDISTRKLGEEILRRQATVDGVTGLSNRRSFESSLKFSMQRVRRDGVALSVVLIEIDRLTEIRHSYGQQVADAMLADFADRMIGCASKGDLVAHLGGDEFAILVERVADAIAVPRLAAGIRLALERRFVWEQSEIAFSASIGAVYFAGGGEDAAELLARADAAVNIAFLDGTRQHVMPMSRGSTAGVRGSGPKPHGAPSIRH